MLADWVITDIFFRRVDAYEILHKHFSPNLEEPSMDIDRKRFLDYALIYRQATYTEDELDCLYRRISSTEGKDEYRIADELKRSVFMLPLHLASLYLTEKNNEPACHFQFYLEWSEVSRRLGEDLFTTIQCAYKDCISRRQRHFFSWKPTLTSDNERIRGLLRKGIAENHFHFFCSSPYFELSWISLMNSIRGRSQAFRKLECQRRLEPEMQFNFAQIRNIEDRGRLYFLVKKAAFIRAWLFSVLHDEVFANEISTHLGKLHPEQESYLDVFITPLQSLIEQLKYIHGRRFNNEIPDYCIPLNLTTENINAHVLLYGERHFLYSVFRAIFSRKEPVYRHKDLFYAYLVIKEKLRQELVQVNEQIGFANFKRYQDRKEYFIPEHSEYHRALYSTAINSPNSYQKLVSFEARITPEDSAEKIARTITACDNYIDNGASQDPPTPHPTDHPPNHFYVLHFAKRPDEDTRRYLHFDPITDTILRIRPRHATLRRNIRTRALALMQLRKEKNPVARRILGIDAASTEIGCRPEVFAHAFRFLKNHHLDGRNDHLLGTPPDIPKLGATFHAGEDFYDIVDGLRAIEEAIFFLDLGRGDRIGHAIALGIEPRDFYQHKGDHLMLPRHELLDNVVWLLEKLRAYAINLPNLIPDLEQWYNQLFLQLYIQEDGRIDSRRWGSGSGHNSQLGFIPHSVFHDAWMLRGDDPACYFSGRFERNITLTYWDRCAINETHTQLNILRRSDEITRLYHLYHYDPNVKRRGEVTQGLEVDNAYVQAIRIIQDEMQKEIRDKGIAIETNPSSNYLIGSFRRYDRHPLVRFFNLGLTCDPQELHRCPQMFVSINTDDQGVFNTCLEKEYTLMAAAMERAKDDQGRPLYCTAMIYDWLDRIREMGIEQSFHLQHHKGAVDDYLPTL